ncbi:MAG: sigma factor-like helix-turn-helix DNA-binding protein [Flavisolibacter sp.]
MTVQQAKQDLVTYRSEQRDLRKKIDALRKYLRDKGIDPDPPAVDLTARNNAMYSRYLDGLTWTEIASEFKLSKERVKQICKRVEVRNEKNARRNQMEE